MSPSSLNALQGKRALITGAGQGIGRGCALELARSGADVVLNDLPQSQALQETAESVRKLGGDCWTVEADIFSKEGCQTLVSEAVRRAGAIDILISNPAYGIRESFLEFPDDEFDKVVEATFKSGFRLCQAVARHMVQRGRGGKIVFISSVHAGIPFARSAPYGASKAALNHLTQSTATELSAHRINVNAIEPGWIDTPGERSTFSEEVLAAEAEKLPWGRLGTPEDIGRAAAFLVSEAADYITGAILPVDGGFRFKDLRAEVLPDEKSLD